MTQRVQHHQRTGSVSSDSSPGSSKQRGGSSAGGVSSSVQQGRQRSKSVGEDPTGGELFSLPQAPARMRLPRARLALPQAPVRVEIGEEKVGAEDDSQSCDELELLQAQQDRHQDQHPQEMLQLQGRKLKIPRPPSEQRSRPTTPDSRPMTPGISRPTTPGVPSPHPRPRSAAAHSSSGSSEDFVQISPKQTPTSRGPARTRAFGFLGFGDKLAQWKAKPYLQELQELPQVLRVQQLAQKLRAYENEGKLPECPQLPLIKNISERFKFLDLSDNQLVRILAHFKIEYSAENLEFCLAVEALIAKIEAIDAMMKKNPPVGADVIEQLTKHVMAERDSIYAEFLDQGKRQVNIGNSVLQKTQGVRTSDDLGTIKKFMGAARDDVRKLSIFDSYERMLKLPLGRHATAVETDRLPRQAFQ